MKNISFWASRFVAVLAIAASIVFFSACGEDDLASPTSGRVRFVHAVADAPPVTITVDGKAINLISTAAPDSLRYTFGFPGFTDSSYLSVPNGDRAVVISRFGTTTPLLTATLPVAAGSSYTVFAVDSAARLGALVVQDQFSAPKTRTSFVRFAHLSPNAPSVDLVARFYRTTTGTNTRVFTDSVTLSSARSYRSVSNWADLRTDSCDIEVRLAGTNTIAVSLQRQRLLEGRHYTIMARGFLGRTSPQNLAMSTMIHGR